MSTVRTLYIVRHGQSAANAGLATDDPQRIPLTDEGRRQADALAQALSRQLPGGPGAVITSHYERAMDTARPLCARWQLAPAQHPLLHEFVTLAPACVAGMNVEQRKPLVDAYWAQADPGTPHGEGAESFAIFAQRVATFRAALPDLADGSVIFGHGMWFAMLIWQLQGFDGQDSVAMRAFRGYQLALPMPNCGVYRLSGLGGEGPWAVQFDSALYRYLHQGCRGDDGRAEAQAAVMAGA